MRIAMDRHGSKAMEAFGGSKWRKGVVEGILSRKRYLVSFKDTDKQQILDCSDLRPPMEWEDGIWKTRESPLAQGSGSKSIEITAQGKTSNTKTLEPTNQNGLGKQPTREKVPEEHDSEDNSRKRKRKELEHNSSDLHETVLSSNLASNYVAADEAKDTTMVLPFAKKSPIWKTYESMEVFKRLPQSPHFSPMFEVREAFREGYALGMMVTFSGLLEDLKALEKDVLKSQLDSLKDSFTELEKHGFNVAAPLSRINKLLAFKDRQVRILETQESFYEEMTSESSKKHKAEQEVSEMERKKLEVEHKILELQIQEVALREDIEAAKERKDSAYKKISQMESCARDLGVELENVEFEFETILSAPW
ncbi:unnamed protein product [Thlaspi arvense]|uniref:Agenet domain-containing protein n=1 Tax=Thlaspi arvense TaxID=13288 RepID=A0AAU9RSA2_THLAR|nr:unnamed protein product [Thlaspi arvense]